MRLVSYKGSCIEKDFYLRQTQFLFMCFCGFDSCVQFVIFEGGLSIKPACRFINSYRLDPWPADPFISVIISVSVLPSISPAIPPL